MREPIWLTSSADYSTAGQTSQHQGGTFSRSLAQETGMESNNQENAPLIGAKGIEAPRRLLLDLQKLQSEVQNSVPEGPRTYLRMDKSGQTQILSVSFLSSCCVFMQSNTSCCTCAMSADTNDEL